MNENLPRVYLVFCGLERCRTYNEEHSRHTYVNFVGAGTRVYGETGSSASVKPSRTFKCTKCLIRGGDATRTDELRRIRTWHGATRLAAREELAERAPTQTYPTAPFQPTRPNDRPNRRWRAGTNTIPVPVSPAPSQPPAAIPLLSVDLSTCIPIYPWTFIPGPDRRGRDPVESDTCRTLYLHAINAFLSALILRMPLFHASGGEKT